MNFLHTFQTFLNTKKQFSWEFTTSARSLGFGSSLILRFVVFLCYRIHRQTGKLMAENSLIRFIQETSKRVPISYANSNLNFLSQRYLFHNVKYFNFIWINLNLNSKNRNNWEQFREVGQWRQCKMRHYDVQINMAFFLKHNNFTCEYSLIF